MDHYTLENGNGVTAQDDKTTLEKALELTGDGIYKYLVIFVSGINLLAGINISLIMAYVIPVAECDMKLTSTEKGLLTSISFTGMLFSSHLFGFLSDTYGRRFVIIRCNLICAFLCFLASIAPNFTWLTIIWFANGFVVAGTITPSYVITSEFCAFRIRTKSLLITAAISSLVSVYLPCIALLVMHNDILLPLNLPLLRNLYSSPWRLYLAITSIPLIIGTFSFIFLPESPKYLLSKGNKDETLNILKKMFMVNTKNKPNQYPVKDVYLDPDDELDNFNKKQGFIKAIFKQTCLLFKPPLLSYMLASSAACLAIVGAYNIIMLWLPDNISKMMSYEKTRSQVTTLCYVLNHYENSIKPEHIIVLNSSQNDLNQTTYYDLDNSCTTDVDLEVYVINIIIGMVQFLTFGLSSTLTSKIGRKPIIVLFIMLSSVCSFLINFVSIPYTSICLGLIVVLIGAVLPFALSIIVDFFPTHVRSMALCICMIFGRLGATSGSQLFGLLRNNYCEISYYILTGFMVGTGFLCLMIPLKN